MKNNITQEVNSIKIFEDKNIRTLWDENQEKWFISIFDVIEMSHKLLK
jgi:hypothetical protein